MTLDELYEFAEQHNIDVDWCLLKRAESLSVPLYDGFAIAIDPTRVASRAEEKDKLGHEVGHCMTGSFYSRHAPLDERGRCEERANRWEINNVLPFDDLREAVRSGLTALNELAEHFCMPETFIRRALDYYTGPRGLTFE